MNRLLATALALFCLVQQDALSFSLIVNHQSPRHHHGGRRTTSHSQAQRPLSSSLSAMSQKTTTGSNIGQSTTRTTSSSVAMMMMTTALVVLVTTLGVAFGGPLTALADEYGVEKEAPTLLTGETVEICTKRGILGACLQTEMRTESNDNDKAKKYFRDPMEMVREKEAVLRGTMDSGSPESTNTLVEKLRQQTLDNKERNRLDVERRTFENDQSALNGPFNQQVIIMNTDGKTFTLLSSPQAMRLKSSGFINERRQFITQPTAEDLDAALEQSGGGEGLAGALQAIFGGGGGSQ